MHGDSNPQPPGHCCFLNFELFTIVYSRHSAVVNWQAESTVGIWNLGCTELFDIFTKVVRLNHYPFSLFCIDDSVSHSWYHLFQGQANARLNHWTCGVEL